MRRLTTFVAVSAATSSIALGLCIPALTVAATPTWVWTESYSESVVVSKVRIPCLRVRPNSECSVVIAQKELTSYNAQLAACKAMETTAPDRAVGCLENLAGQRDPNTNLSEVRDGFPLQTATCVGGGTPDKAGIRFPQFRCKITLRDEDLTGSPTIVSGRIVVYVTGRATFRWQVI